MKRKIMACILAAALGITGVSFPTAAKTVSVGKNVKNEKPMRIQDKNIGKYREKSEKM